ncbi:MAG: c-type cytochrome [Acidobacteriota bacterium]
MNTNRRSMLFGRVIGRPALFFWAGLAVVSMLAGGCGQQSMQKSVAPLERGKYLVNILGCHDCHTPFKMGPKGPEPDMSKMLAGHPENLDASVPPKSLEAPWVWAATATNTAFAGPWGITYAANLTPDQNTGLGIWTENQFFRALKEGKHMGQSRMIMPPMPWQAYSHLTEEDLRAVFAYLRSIPSITNHVPDYQSPEDLSHAGK